MKYNSVIVEELTTTRTSRLIPRCMVLAFAAGIVFYCFYSVIQVPVNEITSARLTSGNTRCECDLDSIDRSRLFYNRVPKCGSTTLITLMRKLSARNNYSHFHSKVFNRKSVDETEQRRIVKQIKGFPSPSSFDQHVFFINFTRFGESPPLFINLIRDPVERIISSYYYRRKIARLNKTNNASAHWIHKKFEHCVLTPDPECTFVGGNTYIGIQVPFFCGQELQCRFLNEPASLQRAKRNIEKYYSVVGTLEDMNMTLRVLEAVLPQFFGGVSQMYHAMGIRGNQNLEKEQVKEEIKDILRANLTAEYELYYFVQQRLYHQYQTLVEEPKQVSTHKRLKN